MSCLGNTLTKWFSLPARDRVRVRGYNIFHPHPASPIEGEELFNLFLRHHTRIYDKLTSTGLYMTRCPNCGQKTTGSGDYCQYCRYPILKGGRARQRRAQLLARKQAEEQEKRAKAEAEREAEEAKKAQVVVKNREL